MDKVIIRPGDIFGIKGSGILGWMARTMLVTPSGKHTDRYHFGMIGDYVFDEAGKFVDFETRESLWKGPAVYRFFKQYTGKDVELYRIKGITMEEGRRAVRYTSAVGNCAYGYRDFILLFKDLFRLLAHGKFPPYTAQQLKYSANDCYICTELVAYAAREIGHPIEPPDSPDIWDIPTVYKQAEEEGRIERYYKGDLSNLVSST